jgi:hypothetical protein
MLKACVDVTGNADTREDVTVGPQARIDHLCCAPYLNDDPQPWPSLLIPLPSNAT